MSKLSRQVDAIEFTEWVKRLSEVVETSGEWVKNEFPCDCGNDVNCEWCGGSGICEEMEII